jgi:outer membrane protein assembly factor BamB
MRITRVKLAGRLTFLTVLTTGGLTAGGLSVGTMTALHAQQWPSFRGAGSSGVAATGTPPVAWDLAGSKNVAWSTPIPGLSHSSPVVWGDRVFLTTAINTSSKAPDLKSRAVELEGSSDMGQHQWKVYSLDRRTGKVLWEKVVYEGVPRVKRHGKASHASASPATDGKFVVVSMGSEGLYCFDMEGTLQWKKDLGVLDVGWVDQPENQWGPASSPIIDGDLVIFQDDRQRSLSSHLIAFDLKTGKEVWRTKRDEIPAWATPVIHKGASRQTIITNASRYIRGYDERDGRELWQHADFQATNPGKGVGDGQVKVSTPVLAGDLAIVTGGWPSAARPIYALRVADGTLAWKVDRGSPYTPTPIVYEDLLYVVTDNGVLGVYDVKTGTRVYQRRIAEGAGGFSASPVAAAGRIYFTSEDGIVYVVRAGRTFELMASNDMREVCMATPAIVDDMMIVRTRTRVYGLIATAR